MRKRLGAHDADAKRRQLDHAALAAALSLLSAQAVRRARASAARARAGGAAAAFPHRSGRLAGRSRPRDRDHAGGLSHARRAVPLALAPFRGRRRGPLGGASSRAAAWRDPAERARAAFDLAMVSVLLDAGAGPDWTYRDAGKRRRASAAPRAWRWPALICSRPARSPPIRRSPLRVDAAALQAHDQRDAVPALPGRRRQSAAGRRGPRGAAAPARCGRRRRAGDLRSARIRRARAASSTTWSRMPATASIAAPDVLAAVLRHLGPVWPSRLELDGVPLGDCWRHPALTTDDATSGLVPLHKLSQWLTYSLLEPLQERRPRGRATSTASPALPNTATAGLLIDTGVLVLRDPADAAARARGQLDAGGGVAGAHRGAARPAGGDRAAAAAAWMPRRCHWPRSCRAARGPPAGRSRARAGPTARRRSRSSATARSSDQRSQTGAPNAWTASPWSSIRWCSTS